MQPASAPPSHTDTRPYVLERVDDAVVVQVYADGFAELPLREKVLIWHLYLAAVAGRDIFYDQRYGHNLAMREVLEGILTHASGIDEATLSELRRYTKLFWINTGPYNNLTARKFVLKLTRPRWPWRCERRVGGAGVLRQRREDAKNPEILGDDANCAERVVGRVLLCRPAE